MYVTDRPQRRCGVCDIPEVLQGEADQPQGYHILHRFRGVFDCLPPITGREKLGYAAAAHVMQTQAQIEGV